MKPFYTRRHHRNIIQYRIIGYGLMDKDYPYPSLMDKDFEAQTEKVIWPVSS